VSLIGFPWSGVEVDCDVMGDPRQPDIQPMTLFMFAMHLSSAYLRFLRSSWDEGADSEANGSGEDV